MAKSFKARIDKPSQNMYAMEIWFKADNIVDAANSLVDTLGPLGISGDNVTRLIEIGSDDDDEEELPSPHRTQLRRGRV